MLIAGAQESDLEQREQIYMDAEQIVYDDMARLSVVWVPGARFYRTDVQGTAPVVFRDWYEKMWLASE